MAPDEQTEFSQDKRGGTDGGDVLVDGEVGDHPAHAVVVAQIGGAGKSTGQHDIVVLVEVDLIEGDITADGDLLGAYGIACGHGRDKCGAHTAAAQNIDDGEAFDGLETIGYEYGNTGHGKSSLRAYDLPIDSLNAYTHVDKGRIRLPGENRPICRAIMQTGRYVRRAVVANACLER